MNKDNFLIQTDKLLRIKDNILGLKDNFLIINNFLLLFLKSKKIVSICSSKYIYR